MVLFLNSKMNLRNAGILCCSGRNDRRPLRLGRIAHRLSEWFDVLAKHSLTELFYGFAIGIVMFGVASTVAAEPLTMSEDFHLKRTIWNFSRSNDTNFDDWPDDWQRKTGRRYPKYVKVGIAALDPEVEQQFRSLDTMMIRGWPTLKKKIPELPALPPSAADALVNRYLKVELDGGLVMVQSPKVKVSHAYQYRFSARVMTQGLRYNRARVEFIFLDDKGEELDSHPTRSVMGSVNWKDLVVDRVRAPAAAIDVVVRLIVEGSEDGLEDIRGTVGFDDLRIEPFPQLQLTTNEPSAIFEQGSPIQITSRILGFPKGANRVRFELLDANNERIAQHVSSIEDEKSTEPSIKKTKPVPAAISVPPDMQVIWELPRLPPGFYRVRASLQGQTLRTLATETTLAVIDSTIGETSSAGCFGWTLSEGTDQMPPRELAAWLVKLGVSWAKIPCWVDPRDLEKIDRIAETCARIQEAGIQTVGMLDVPPENQVSQYDVRGRRDVVASQLFRDARVWQPLLEPIMSRLTLKVRLWQLGSDRDQSFLGRSQLEESITAISSGLQGYGQPIEIAIGWPWSEPQLPRDQTTWQAVCRSDDPDLTAEELDSHLQLEQNENRDRPTRTWVVIDPIDKRRYDRDARITDMVLRMATVRKHRVQATFVTNPHDIHHGLLTPESKPDEMLLPWRTTARMLGNLRQVGSLSLRSKSQNIVFAGTNRTVVMLWSKDPCIEKIFLGDELRVVDVWGKTTSLLTEFDGSEAFQSVAIGPVPVFLVGADPSILAFRMSVNIEPTQLDSLLGQEQSIAVSFTNPTREGVVGSLGLRGPEHWIFDDPVNSWELMAGKSTTSHFPVVLGNSAKVGPYEIALEFEYQTVPPKRFVVYREISVGPIGLELKTSTAMAENNQLRVEIEMVNRSNRTQAYDCMLFPQQDRQYQRRFITVPAGETVRREFFWDNAEPLVGTTMLLRASEQDGKRILNYDFPVRR